MPVRQKSFFLLLLVAFALGLTLLSFWVVRMNRARPEQGFMMSNVSVSVEFKDRQFLTGTTSRFAYGARQVYFRFDYSRLERDTQIDVLWAWGEKRVQAETYDLPAPSGTRVYCLLKENGSPLPRGPYAVTVRCGTELMPTFHFEIY